MAVDRRNYAQRDVPGTADRSQGDAPVSQDHARHGTLHQRRIAYSLERNQRHGDDAASREVQDAPRGLDDLIRRHASLAREAQERKTHSTFLAAVKDRQTIRPGSQARKIETYFFFLPAAIFARCSFFSLSVIPAHFLCWALRIFATHLA